MTTPQVNTPAALGLTWPQATVLEFLSGSDKQLDPIRIMKGLFVFSMEAPEAWLPKEERHHFVPYSYGPYSQQVNSDLGQLGIKGYVQMTLVPGKSWSYYSLTSEGESVAERIAPAFNPAAIDYLRRLREFVVNLSFRQLLDTIYAKYPEYAVNSVFKF